MAETYRTESYEDFTRTIGEFVDDGYEVKDRDDTSATLVRNRLNAGRLVVAHWALAIFTLGVGNVILLGMQMCGAFKEKVKVRRDS